MESQVTVHKILSQSDLNLNLDRITDTLSKAFFNDPYYVYIMPNDQKRIEQIKWWMKILLRYSFKNGEIYITSDGKGVSMWVGPNNPTLDNLQLALFGLIFYPFKVGIMNFIRMLDVSTGWEKVHAKQDKRHYYLPVIGVDPEMQRKGYGRLLLKDVLVKADNEKLKCHLETVTKGNVSFYESLQFKSIMNKGFGDNYTYWVMTREPQSRI